jgi:uncharacterized membrane protein
LAVGLAAWNVVSDDYALQSFWQGASIDPDNLPSVWLLRGAGVLTSVIAWAVASWALADSRGFSSALGRVAPGFAGFLSILVLNTIDAYTGFGVMYWSVLAAIFSTAFLAAWVATLATSRERGIAWRANAALGRRAAVAVALAGLAYLAVSGTLSFLQYRAVRVPYRDNSCYEEMLWRTLHGEFLLSSCFGERSFLAQHVEFIQLLYVPLYLVWPGMMVLMWAQAAGLASGVIPVYLLAKRKLDSRSAAALFSIAYIFYAPMQYVDKRLAFGTFIPEALAIPALLWALYFLERANVRGLVVSGLAAALCKEDMALPVAMMGLVLVWRGRRKWGMPIFVGGFAWFVVSLAVVVPHFAGGQSHTLDAYTGMGGSIGGVSTNVLTHPLRAAQFFFEFKRVSFLLMMLVPMGLLALCSPAAVLIFLPSIASNNLALWEPSSTIFFHYHISLVPFAVGGAVMGAGNLVRLLPRANLAWGGVTAAARPALVAVFTGVLVCGASIGGDVVYGKFPLSFRFYNPESPGYWRHIYVETPRAKWALETVAPSIPATAKVSASQFLATLFTRNKRVYLYPEGLEDADYVVVERDEPSYFSTRYSVMPVLEEGPKVEGFKLVGDKEGIYVFQRDTGEGDRQ